MWNIFEVKPMKSNATNNVFESVRVFLTHIVCVSKVVQKRSAIHFDMRYFVE